MTRTADYKPLRFFLITFAATWLLWIPAAWLSWRGDDNLLAGALMAFGLLGPLAGSAISLAAGGNRELRRDFSRRLFDLRRIRPAFVPFIFLFMPAVMVVAILVSPVIGQSLDQLAVGAEFAIMDGSPLMSLIIPILAPALEELGWSGYGIDSLKSRATLFRATAIFAVLWAMWHLPLFFVKGYYHHSLWNENALYAANFFLSVIPLTFLTNWLYYKNNRSIPSAILFHIVVVLSCEAFLVTNATKCIVTVVLTAVAVVVLKWDRGTFFGTANVVVPSAASASPGVA
ncbi:MAG: CPBP family intramembrane metalloprotease [Planctomycetes bacterium]|nr:CPBP family intramembrane metalloprotease [Planctomycetota bacterium]